MIFRDHGTELDRAAWSGYIGSSFDPVAHLEELIGRQVDRAGLRARHRERHLANVHSQPLLPGVSERLAEAGRMGLALGVASSSSRGWVEGHLEHRGILGLFGAVRTADDVLRLKPDPEVYRSVVDALGALPHETVAIEDSVHGVAAARAAGLHCIAVPNAMTRHLRLDDADLRIGSLAEQSFASLFPLLK